ncbi:hypothetical protein [Burkholderia metallica]|uniref:hypothetical protein n=1 Tax=Burkholderia metallica TaxID=488729 RepID=UPI001CF34B93|nr:hypothetical protein [Burkholderia metallica]MCA8023610.1 hypothetical protein [Burkholderia metallica]
MIADLETAKKINELMLSIGASLNESIFFVIDTCSDEDVKKYKLLIGNIMGGLYDVMVQIYIDHPTIKPKELL